MPKLHYPIVQQVNTQNGEISVKLELTLNLNINAESGVVSCGTEIINNTQVKEIKDKEVDYIIPDFTPTKELLDFGK